jgi:hypothetical protein
MSELKRRTSSRIKTEPAAKRRLSELEAEEAKAAEKPTKSSAGAASKKDAAAKAVKETPVLTLPTKISDNKPLPVLSALQSLSLLDSEYQSVKERWVRFHPRLAQHTLTTTVEYWRLLSDVHAKNGSTGLCSRSFGQNRRSPRR